MSHLDDIRISELALDPRAEPRGDEASHLEKCDLCTVRLSEERRLSTVLSVLPGYTVPSEFASSVAARFVRESKAAVRFAPALVGGILLALVLAAVMIFLVLANLYNYVGDAAMVLGKLATVVRALYVALSRIPDLTEIVTVTSMILVLASTAGMASLVKKSARVK